MRATGSSVWWHAFGYFACYVPYAALVKVVSSTSIGGAPPLSGPSLLAVTTLASAVAMFATISILGWWKHAGRHQLAGVSVPLPNRWTLLSGIATAVIVMTTTLAYTFQGLSIALAMLLMRGGVLLLSPVIDALHKRKVRWYSWVALVLSLLALAEPVLHMTSTHVPPLAALDIGLYLVAYFVRLSFMSNLAKSDNESLSRKYFVEEQMVATPVAFVMVGIAAMVPWTQAAFLPGFTIAMQWPIVGVLVLIGVFSQGTGAFGGLVLLDARENTFCVPLNRAASIVAGIVASLGLAALSLAKVPKTGELVGSLLLVVSVVVLSLGSLQRARRDL